MLKKYFDIQKKHQKRLYDLEHLSDEDRIKLSKDFILSAHKELSEVLDCLNWKSHRKEDKRFIKSNFEEEVIDVFKYLINLCVIWNISPKTFDETFDNKTTVVEQRFKQEFQMKGLKNEKVCALDLDDTLNEWEVFFVKKFNENNKTSFASLEEIKNNVNSLEFAKFKHWFRDSGVKAFIPAKKGASEFTHWLKRKGYRIVIISSRPYKEYSRIYPDTINELKRNRIVFDDLYFDENKHLTILKKFPKLKFMVEDKKEYVEQVAREGYRVFYIQDVVSGDRLINIREDIGDEKSKNVIVVSNLESIKEFIK